MRKNYATFEFHRFYWIGWLLIIFLIFSYINYSNIAAKLLRRALKPELRAEAAKRDESHIKFTPWANGKPARTYSSFHLVYHQKFHFLPIFKSTILMVSKINFQTNNNPFIVLLAAR